MKYLSSNNIRLAIISEIDYNSGIAYTYWIDQVSDHGPHIQIPHPYAGQNGEGIFIGIKPGSIVALAMIAYERYVPVAILPNIGNYGDITETNEIIFDNVGFPNINDGEIIINGVTGSQLSFTNDGNVSIINAFNEGKIIGGNIDNSHRCSINVDSPVEYYISQSGIKVSGLIRRDVRFENESEQFTDFLKNINSELIYEEVCRNPNKQISYITNISNGNKNFRNPPFVEDRKIIFEYGRDWNVGTYDEELTRLQNNIIPYNNFEYRRERRGNVLSLGLTYPNELIEVICGTLVDVFGNILDINKNIIKPLNEKNEKQLLQSMLETSRHSVAYYMEINARKGYGYRGKTNTRKPSLLNDFPDVESSTNNTRDRSRWSLKIDKEGLTTINIPATSETGNIPLLTRQETSSVLEVDDNGILGNKQREKNDTKELFRNKINQDIFLEQFGPGGINIKGLEIKNRLKNKTTSWNDSTQQIVLPNFIQAGTAFHNITQTANAIIQKDINKLASHIFINENISPGLNAISSEINVLLPNAETNIADRNKITGLVENQPNAGGRSLQINLDGSLESSIGANTIDRIAWTLDTAGAIVARIGRDRQGRSAIIQTDGYLLLEVGGWDYIGDSEKDTVDTRFVGGGLGNEKRKNTLPGDPNRFRSGKVIIRVRRSSLENDGPDKDGDDQLLIIDDSGITIKSVGQFNLISKGNMTIESGGQLMLNGEVIRFNNSSPTGPVFHRSSRNRIG